MGVIEVFYIVDFGSLYIYVKIYQPVHVDLCILLNVDYNSILRIKKTKEAFSMQFLSQNSLEPYLDTF